MRLVKLYNLQADVPNNQGLIYPLSVVKNIVDQLNMLGMKLIFNGFQGDSPVLNNIIAGYKNATLTADNKIEVEIHTFDAYKNEIEEQIDSNELKFSIVGTTENLITDPFTNNCIVEDYSHFYIYCGKNNL